MAFKGFGIREGGKFSEFLDEMPTAPKRFVREGLRSLSRIPESAWETIISVAIDTLETEYPPDLDDLTTKLGLKPDEAGNVVGAVGMLMAMFTSSDEGVEDFVNAATTFRLIDESQREPLKRFGQLVTQEHEAIKSTLSRSSIGEEVLPSLVDFQISIDLRLKFEKDKVAETSPVAIIHLDTDAENQLIWFQLSRKQLKRLTIDLQKALNRLDQAEKWATTK
jgi:hypothetical protein